MPRRSPFVIQLAASEREALEARSRKYTSPYRDVVRVKIVLMAAQGLENKTIASRLDLPVQIVCKWRKRFFEQRFANLKAAVPDCVLGVYAGGRDWLPITTSAIMLGVDVVRVGMEDCLWVYPHKDEIIKKNSDVIAKIATIARELGREVASPDTARRVCGMKKP